MAFCNCGRYATQTGPRNDAARCDRYPLCDRADADDDVDCLRADLARVTAERDESRQWVEDYKADHRAVVDGRCAGDERHCSCVPHLRRALDEARAEVEAMKAVADDLAKLLKMHHVGHGAFDRKGCGVCRPIDAALAALRTRKVGG